MSFRSFPLLRGGKSHDRATPHDRRSPLLTIAITAWVIGAGAYYIIRLTQTFYQENQTPIQNAIANLFGG